VHWAHQVADRFPDGQLYLNLRGYYPGPPVPVADALAAFLRALGVPGSAIPGELEERAALYRSLLAERRMLVVLDNAADSAQVRPLLPGAPGCMAVVTSRDSLAGLVARNGARRVRLDALPIQDAVSLLRALVGARVDADPGAAAGLAELCCRLPLALRVAAELAVARPTVQLADLVAELGDEQRQLDLLDADGDPGTAVRAVLSWSFRHLDPAARRMFLLLAVHPGPDIDTYAAAALSDSSLYEASRMLDRLARAHLIQPTTQARFGMHDLLRRYAADEAAKTMTPAERESAHGRLLGYLQDTATRAESLAESHTRSSAIMQCAMSEHAMPDLADPAEAKAWLRTERSVLLACLDQTTADGQLARVVALTAALTWLLRADGGEQRARHATAASAAQGLGDQMGQAHALLCLGVAQQLAADPDTGATLARASEIFGDLGEKLGRGDALRALGYWRMIQRDRRAAQTLVEAQSIFRQLGDPIGLSETIMSLAEVQRTHGMFANATALAREALAIIEILDDRRVRAAALLRVSLAECVTDSYPAAVQSVSEALSIFRGFAVRGGVTDALNILGELQCVTGDYPSALQNLTEALGMACEMGWRVREADALISLGIARHQQVIPKARRGI
jgi:hypothetical protein